MWPIGDTTHIVSVPFRLAVLLCVLAVAIRLSAQPTVPFERFAAAALSRTDPLLRTQLEVNVERWSDDSEGEQLAAALRHGGTSAVLDELKRHRSVGQIRSISGMTRSIRYARDIRSTTGARYMLLFADPPFAEREFFEGMKTSDGTLVAVAIWLGANGGGEGQVTLMERIGIDSAGSITVDFRDPPVVLPSIARQPQ
jgi:hypothetical protein